ncbi:hypothetical protein OAF05_01000 [bacterium]|nr:hypothetical protein [bacterium]
MKVLSEKNAFTFGLICASISSLPFLRILSLLVPFACLGSNLLGNRSIKLSLQSLKISAIISVWILLSTIIFEIFANSKLQISGLGLDQDVFVECVKCVVAIFSITLYWNWFSKRVGDLYKSIKIAFGANFLLICWQLFGIIFLPSIVRSKPQLFLLNIINTNVHGGSIDLNILQNFLRPSGFYTEPSFLAPIFSLYTLIILCNATSEKNVRIKIFLVALMSFFTLSPSVIASVLVPILFFVMTKFFVKIFRVIYISQWKLRFSKYIAFFIAFSPIFFILNSSLGGEGTAYIFTRVARYAAGGDARNIYIQRLLDLYQNNNLFFNFFGFGLYPIGNGTTNSFVDIACCFGILGCLLFFLYAFKSLKSISLTLEKFSLTGSILLGLILSLLTNSFLLSPMIISWSILLFSTNKPLTRIDQSPTSLFLNS